MKGNTDGRNGNGANLPLRQIIAARLDPYLRRKQLTKTERSVVRSIFNGCSTAEAAHARDRSVNTMKTHLRAIHRKLQVRDRQALILKIIEEL